MTSPSRRTKDIRFSMGLMALAGIVACGIGLPALEGKPSLVHCTYGGAVFLVVSLPLLVVAVWGVTTANRQVAATTKNGAKMTAKRPASQLSLGCAAFLLAPVGAALAGYICTYILQVHPMDRSYTVATFAGIGFFAGCVVTAAILITSIVE